MIARLVVLFTVLTIGLIAICESQSSGQDQSPCEPWTKSQNKKIRCGKKKSMFRSWCPETYSRQCEKKKPSPVADRAQPKKPKKPKATSRPKKVKQRTTKKPRDDRPVGAEANYKACCRAQGVHSSCIGLCTYGDADLRPIFCNDAKKCETYLKVATYCGTNNKDNSACCTRETGKAACSVFCNGASTFPKLEDMFGGAEALKYGTCLESFKKMNDCSKNAYSGQKDWVAKSWTEEVFPKDISEYVRSECGSQGGN